MVSGPVADIEAILARFEADEVRVARLRKSPAYHSTMIEPALGDLEAAISTIAFQPPSATFVSNLTGRALEAGAAPDAAYWRRQAREPVAFRACIETLAELGVDAAIEIGPHAVLGPMTTMAWPEAAGASPAVLSSLQRPSKDEAPPPAGSGGGFLEAVAGAYEAGLQIRFEGLFAGEKRRRIALPGYPFPARALLDRGAQATALRRRPPLAGRTPRIRERGSRLRHGGLPLRSGVAERPSRLRPVDRARARSTAPWRRRPPSPRGAPR